MLAVLTFSCCQQSAAWSFSSLLFIREFNVGRFNTRRTIVDFRPLPQANRKKKMAAAFAEEFREVSAARKLAAACASRKDFRVWNAAITKVCRLPPTECWE
jgi:hypothetical protein